ncbi:hypothetical protein PoB_004593600 [Plakobranchus ocellatus]|uniref:Uncharacterized protein n=1 Tax=Plakobranchus ocellatus TaxID=259542 RepID=A0AAV4BG62_9GAST|nr:hypothetical protein PoB_004593600 [Plakobranchus ocellatus]
MCVSDKVPKEEVINVCHQNIELTFSGTWQLILPQGTWNEVSSQKGSSWDSPFYELEHTLSTPAITLALLQPKEMHSTIEFLLFLSSDFNNRKIFSAVGESSSTGNEVTPKRISSVSGWTVHTTIG